LAIAGKLIGGAIGAWGAAKGYPPLRSALIVGTGMVPRGEVGLIIAGIGRAQGVIPDPIFSALIIMSIVTTLLAPPVLKWLYRLWPERGEPDSQLEGPKSMRSEPVAV
jgi:Kef-type K+ transport system membrane component KefB